MNKINWIIFFTALFFCSCSTPPSNPLDISDLLTFRIEAPWKGNIKKNSFIVKDSVICTWDIDREAVDSIEQIMENAQIDFGTNYASNFTKRVLETNPDLLDLWLELYKLDGHDNIWQYRDEGCNCINKILEKYRLTLENLQDEKTKNIIAGILMELPITAMAANLKISTQMKKEWDLLTERYKDKLLFCEFEGKDKKGMKCNCPHKKNHSLLFNIKILNFINRYKQLSPDIFIFEDYTSHLWADYNFDIDTPEQKCTDNHIFIHYAFFENKEGFLQVKATTLSNHIYEFIGY